MMLYLIIILMMSEETILKRLDALKLPIQDAVLEIIIYSIFTNHNIIIVKLNY